jgi:hypothetical protein
MGNSGSRGQTGLVLPQGIKIPNSNSKKILKKILKF